jgi:cytochrome c biogenesis protein CcmG/thiol:disulfide interchange protein DsbE
MNRRIIGLSVLFLASVISARPQSADLPEAVRVLMHVTQKYTEARNYYIEATEKSTYSGEFDGSWTKKILIASETGRRFHFESKTATGSAISIADGHTVWLRHEGERTYASMAESEQDLSGTIRILNQDEHIKQARRLKASLANLARNLSEANFLPDELLSVNDRVVKCKVIFIREDKGKSADPGASREKSVWIDADDQKILKIVERTLMPADSAGRSKSLEVTTTFNAVLDGELSDCLFTVEIPDVASAPADQPPADQPESHAINLLSIVGKKLPELRLKSPDGATITTSSLLGRPLLIDFWATWCSPCLAALPELGEIYEETNKEGLIFLAVDHDDEPGKGSSFLRKKGYLWPDFNDPEAEAHKQLGYAGIPRVLLVDSTGTVVYDRTGSNLTGLRSRIAKLGLEFETLAPKSGPCTTPR